MTQQELPLRRQICNESYDFTEKQIKGIEDHKSAKFVCETCIRDMYGNWANGPVAIFYQDDPSLIPEGGSAYFGMYWRPNQDASVLASPEDVLKLTYTLMICNAVSATEEDITGIVANNGEIIYSRYRHDYRGSSDGSVWIDGGRDYDRYGWNQESVLDIKERIVTLRIVDGELRIV